MERFEGRCWLDWWANSSTCLASVEASVVVSHSPAGWQAHGQATHDQDLEGFALLCDLDPVFSLRFEDDSTIQVTVHRDHDRRRFTLTEYTGPAQRHIDYTFDTQRWSTPGRP